MRRGGEGKYLRCSHSASFTSRSASLVLKHSSRLQTCGRRMRRGQQGGRSCLLLQDSVLALLLAQLVSQDHKLLLRLPPRSDSFELLLLLLLHIRRQRVAPATLVEILSPPPRVPGSNHQPPVPRLSVQPGMTRSVSMKDGCDRVSVLKLVRVLCETSEQES